MQLHTKIYMEHFGFDISDFIPCTVCGGRATEIHHLDKNHQNNDIENLAAVDRKHHDKCHADPVYNESVKALHKNKLINHEHQRNYKAY